MIRVTFCRGETWNTIGAWVARQWLEGHKEAKRESLFTDISAIELVTTDVDRSLYSMCAEISAENPRLVFEATETSAISDPALSRKC